MVQEGIIDRGRQNRPKLPLFSMIYVLHFLFDIVIMSVIETGTLQDHIKQKVQKMNIIDEISKIGIVPVIALDHAEDAEPLGRALREGGLKCAEVTFRTAAAADAIRILSQTFPDMCVGAGTVLTPAQVDAAVAAGAKFIVSPGLNPTVVSYCVEKNIPIVPGCSSPSDIETALSFGLDVVKFFEMFMKPGQELVSLKYFSAKPDNIDKALRQNAFFQANKENPKFRLILGKYLRKSIRCYNCGYMIQTYEEKRIRCQDRHTNC